MIRTDTRVNQTPHKYSRRLVVQAAAVGIAAHIVKPASAQSSAIVSYTTFEKETLRLRAFLGRNIALLLDPAREIDYVALERVVTALDRAWDWYRGYFGQPRPLVMHAGKPTVAEVVKTCGAGCGYLGATGIELDQQTMGGLLADATDDRYQQAVFYEMGRNFWLFAPQLGTMSALTTGFAIVNRFYAMELNGLMGAPWNEKMSFDTFRYTILVELLERYLADRTLNWQNTIAAGKAPANPHGWGDNDLSAAFYHRIRVDHGFTGYRRFWTLMKGAPPSESPRDSVARIVQIARAVTGTDYRPMFRDNSLPLTVVAPKVSEGTPRRVSYRAQYGDGAVAGTFTRTDGNRWVESNNILAGATPTFRSLSVNADEIMLFDETRDYYIDLDLKRRKSFFRRGANRKWDEWHNVNAVVL
jgi:hypothetical protein